MDYQQRNINACDECNCRYYSDSYKMTNLCPECAHILYGHENCKHEFKNGLCIKCFWDGNVSNYIQKLKDKQPDKSKKILHIVEFFQNKYGATNILINDYWSTDKEAIGLTDRSRQFLAYISTISSKENNYYLALENPPVNNKLPYLPAGEFDNLSLAELENILTRHLKLTD